MNKVDIERRNRIIKKKNRGKGFSIIGIVIVACILIFLAISGTKPIYHEAEINIEKGLGTAAIADILKENKIISSTLLFRYESRRDGYDTKFRYGTFELNNTMTNNEIMEILSTKGASEKGIKVTIPEGYNIKQIARRLEESGLIKEEDFYTALKTLRFDYEFLKDVPAGENYLEGYLFPNTYEFKVGSTPREIIEKFLDGFNSNFKTEDLEKAKSLGYSYHEAIIIASIIEREVRVGDERPKVAGVIYNRLKAKQKLEMCSTVQYILGEQREKLYEVDLQIDSPYNTYMYIGLPVGPIANPGADSIRAALNPETHDYYYFVLMDEAKGVHYFSKTYSEHVGAKSKYIN